MLKLTDHRWLFWLAGDNVNLIKYSRCAVAWLERKTMQCAFIYAIVDVQMPGDGPGRFCLAAVGVAEGFATLAAALAHVGEDTVTFDGLKFSTASATISVARC